ncbi:acyloxyacyl hydrolase [Caenimonas aquaedulcis]|uniref:Acyloxyacyl hydrolase n=1 Tax=Caenimonas aquaedulcis TaxID=2793270 RepID=A0A931MHR3_9BURK|nr:acyloxyacyl hydrolase [Caenimonas aquaedulcis]MBG9389029.1 acyloxyacyl hydrolase [Caenimonas aquaedulcis]
MNIAKSLLLAVGMSGLPFLANAEPSAPKGVFVEGAGAEHGTYSATVGALWLWGWTRDTWAGEVSGISEVWVSHWSARAPAGGRDSFSQIGIQPLLRLRFDGGNSLWFMEGGVGLSYTDVMYRTQGKQFSTKFNFIDSIGVGRSFGPDRKREVSLRITHFSNASIKRPNPGENFLQLRYAIRF